MFPWMLFFLPLNSLHYLIPGCSYEERSDVSPDHHFIAYTMYDKDKDSFTLCVRDLTTGMLCGKPQADRVANLSWAMNGKALLYTVTDNDKRPYRSVK